MVYLLPHTVQHAANRFPEKDAFRCGNRAVTYAELNQQMNQLANLLIELGVRRGDRVGVYLNRSLETALAIYGIMNAGAAYVPIDPHAPPSRTRFLLENCGIEHLVSHRSQRRSLQKVLEGDTNLKTIIGLKEDWQVRTINWETVFQMPTTSPDVRILEKDLAYIMYTSGSTGTPKGIMHTHYSGLNYAKLSADLYDLTDKDCIGNHAPLHFDISTLGYFTAPLIGATTIIVPDAHTKMPASLTQLMAKERMTVWYSVPLALIQMLQRGILEERDMSALRWILYGGEPFPTKHLSTLMQQWPQAIFSNVYGPAEVNQCTFYNLPAPPKDDEPIPIGKVWNNTEMLIVDETDQVVKDGTVGELLIRTGTMMQGYWKQPELTQKGFYHEETSSGFRKTFYRTGDLVRLREDGNLLFLGRKDRQIKTRGYRVELDEVEANLIAHEAINEAAIFPIPNEDEGWLIAAAVILKPEMEATEEELRNHLRGQLPWYAVPQKIEIRTSFPRTGTEKIDRKALQKG